MELPLSTGLDGVRLTLAAGLAGDRSCVCLRLADDPDTRVMLDAMTKLGGYDPEARTSAS